MSTYFKNNLYIYEKNDKFLITIFKYTLKNERGHIPNDITCKVGFVQFA